MKVLSFLLVFSFQAFAVCIPTNQFHSEFLGFSPDASEYAVGHFDKDFFFKSKRGKDSIKSKFCIYKTSSNEKVTCTDLDFAIQGHLEFKRDITKYFKKNYSTWTSPEIYYGVKIDSTLDCRRSRALDEKDSRCIVEISEDIGGMDRKNLLKQFYQPLAHTSPSQMLRTDHDSFVAPNKKAYCFKYQLRHESANCGSFEHPIYCVSL